MDESSKHSVHRETTDALYQKLAECALAIFDFDTQEIASGTLLTVGQRTFVATAAHAIPNSPNERLCVIGKVKRSPSREGRLAIKKHGVDVKCDVGYLELETDIALKFLRQRGCALESVADCKMGDPEKPALLIAYPAGYTSLDARTTTLSADSLAYAARPLSVVQLRKKSPDAVVDESVDVFLDYPESGCRRVLTNEKVMLPLPYGMSGGGIWDQGYDQGLWHPDKARLFAIQSKWDKKARFVRAVQIVHWLRLVFDDYPDLRPILSSQFASLASRGGK